MKSLISSTDYQFSSTIRLFEGDNFSQKLHSVKVYALLPPGRNARLRTNGLSQLVESEEPEINRMVLEDLIKYSSYPVIVVVNYKSKYQMPVIVGEEVTPELIAQRRSKMKKDYNNGLINDDIYRQEKAFTEYLDAFSRLNKNIESYSLAMQMGNQLYISQTLFDIITNYRELLTMQQSRDTEFDGLSAYENIFRPEYESILRNADVYMEKDRNLKSCRTIAENLYLLNIDEKAYQDSTLREKFLSAFYAVDLPADGYMKTSVVGKEILAQINILENRHYKDVFLPRTNKLKTINISDTSQQYRNELLREVNRSNCAICKEKVLEEIRTFDERSTEVKIMHEISKKDSLVDAAADILFELYTTEQCLSSNLNQYRENPPVWLNMIEEQHKELKAQLSLLEVVLSIDKEISSSNLKDITDYNSHIQQLTRALQDGYNKLCSKVEGLCSCN